jgi:hypothetical protein
MKICHATGTIACYISNTIARHLLAKYHTRENFLLMDNVFDWSISYEK